jgi:predicted transcriptional regulator
MGADSMPANATRSTSAAPSIVPTDVPALSDEECLVRLAHAIEEHDPEHLDEVARLIGRLAVTIE